MAEGTPEGQGGPDGGIGQFIADTDKGISALGQMAQQAGAPEDVVAQFQQVSEMFRAAVEGMLAAGQGGAPQQQPAGRQPASQPSSPEAAGNPGARPAEF